MTDRDKAVELLARGLCAATGSWPDMWREWTPEATALLDQIAPTMTAQAVEAERIACTEELRLAVAAARAEERERNNRSHMNSTAFWVRAAEKALAGDTRELQNRVDLCKADPMPLVQSDAIRKQEGV